MQEIPEYKKELTKNLIPYARNSRTHSDEQVNQICASIREFGFTNPILVDDDNNVIAGHGRIMAANKLGIEELPCIVLSGLTEAQKKAYVIADNKLALNAGWDDELLRLEFKDLEDTGFDLSLTGFSCDEIDALQITELEDGLTDEDDVPDTPEKPKTKLGDIWLLGDHRLMCGDSTSKDNIEKLMDGVEWDVCIFDPPYEIEDLYTEAMPVATDNKKLVVMWDFKRFALAPYSALKSGWNPLYEFIWDCVQSWYTPNRPLARHKSIGVFGDDPYFNTEKSIIVDGKKREPKTVRNTRGDCNYTPLDGAKHIATVEAFPNTQQNDAHGHGKPTQWIGAIFNGIGGDVYFDVFGGSGSTLIVCEQQNRKCFTMELDEKYCDVIINRWQDFTGKQAVLESTGQKYSEVSDA